MRAGGGSSQLWRWRAEGRGGVPPCAVLESHAIWRSKQRATRCCQLHEPRRCLLGWSRVRAMAMLGKLGAQQYSI